MLHSDGIRMLELVHERLHSDGTRTLELVHGMLPSEGSRTLELVHGMLCLMDQGGGSNWSFSIASGS